MLDDDRQGGWERWMKRQGLKGGSWRKGQKRGAKEEVKGAWLGSGR